MGFKSKYKGVEIENLLDKMSEGGGGITIVDSVDQLDSSAELGSLASVVEPGSITETLISELPQPDSSIINMDTGFVDATGCPQVSGLSIIVPEGPIPVSMGLTESDMLYFCSESIDLMGGSSRIILGIMPQIVNNEIIALAGMYMNTSTNEEKQWAFFTIQNGVVSIDQAAIDECNTYIKDLHYIGAMMYVLQGSSLTTEQLLIYDNVVKVVAGIPSKAHVYLKKDNWEELYAKDLEKLTSNINSKADIISIKELGYDKVLKPNTYYKYQTAQSIGNINLTLTLANNDDLKYNEYILELECLTTLSAVSFVGEDGMSLTIKWANGVPPTFAEGMTHLISIANGLGVYTMFPNS